MSQIMFYKEMGLELGQIKEAMHAPDFNRLEVLREHLQKLEERRKQLDLLIENVSKTIGKEEGRNTMNNKEKFEGFKKKLIEDNETKYGKEIRESYGDDTVNKSNAKMMNLTEEEYNRMQAMAHEINEILEDAVKNNEYPEDSIGERVALLHKEWLHFTWPTYSPQAHRGLVQMYVADERFKKYYDGNVEGCAEFLKAAVEYHI